jgi:uncharacterized cupin superfamily protein
VAHVTVLRGKIELLVEDEWRELKKGQSLRFPADRRHGYRNRTESEAVVMDLIHYRFIPLNVAGRETQEGSRSEIPYTTIRSLTAWSNTNASR